MCVRCQSSDISRNVLETLKLFETQNLDMCKYAYGICTVYIPMQKNPSNANVPATRCDFCVRLFVEGDST